MKVGQHFYSLKCTRGSQVPQDLMIGLSSSSDIYGRGLPTCCVIVLFTDTICGVFLFRCSQIFRHREAAGNLREPVPADGRHGKTMLGCRAMTCER